jgi:hypothetical protein
MVVGTEVVGTEEAAYTMKFTKVSKYRQVSAFFESNSHCTLRESLREDPEAVLESCRISESGPAQAGPDPTSPTPVTCGVV